MFLCSESTYLSGKIHDFALFSFIKYNELYTLWTKRGEEEMATKLYNSHLSKIIFECNEYYILDAYISLVNISSEVNSKYLIQTFNSSKVDLIALVRRNLNVSYKTVFNCIDKLKNSHMLVYFCSHFLQNMGMCLNLMFFRYFRFISC